MATEIRVPTLGESVSEATVGTWFKKVGDAIKADEPIVELETDKVTVEVPAPAAGTLSEIVAKAGETVGLGALLGQIAEGGCRMPAASRLPLQAGSRRAGCRQPAPTGKEAAASRRSPAARRHRAPPSPPCRRHRRPRRCLPKTTFPPIRSTVAASAARC